jgi:phosphatidylglycerol---prolipoprotein diacylglyceryl transferase
MTVAPYSVLMALGIAGSFLFWRRLARRSEPLLAIYITALCGAFIGAKLVYLFAEGWMHFGATDQWMQLATGKSILGALLGGYVAVELAKRWLGYDRATGDWFAAIVPVALIIGRTGCLLQGCCLGKTCPRAWYTLDDHGGQARWPAVPVEMLFNAVALGAFFVMRKRGILPGQHFHIYLIAYGLFRFAHEFVRDTPALAFGVSGYQLAALAVAALGAWGFVRRERERPALAEPAIV